MTSPRVLVVGAGVGGLSAAVHLDELARSRNFPVELRLLEAAPRAGGVVSTERRDGFLLEHGPDNFITEKPWGLDLCRRLGLEPEIIGTRREFARSFVVWGGKLIPTPEGFYLLAPSRWMPMITTPLFSWRGKIRMAAELWIPRAKGRDDESLASFVRRRFGGEALERMAQPMVAGIYAADPETLSLRATFPKFLQWESEHGSVLGAMLAARRRKTVVSARGPRYGIFVTLRDGLGRLTEELQRRLPAGALRLDCAVTALRRAGGRWRVATADGREETADAVCLALPAVSSAPLLHSLDPALADALRSVPYNASAVIHFAYRRSAVRHPLDGFGFVVPEAENRPLSACTFSHVKYEGRAPAEHALLRVFVSGPRSGPLLEKSDAELTETVRKSLEKLLGIKENPLFSRLARHAVSLPQYTLGHLDRTAVVEDRVRKWPGLALAGNAFSGVGIPDCVRSGEAAARSIFEMLNGGSPAERASALPTGALG
ncbi:MAG TPA: protoporphyrinogen oxidase [Elusimicrobiota bacterium]|nr:protoporphyrinogen oxidase [Elusimicrobiota bacterium]